MQINVKEVTKTIEHMQETHTHKYFRKAIQNATRNTKHA